MRPLLQLKRSLQTMVEKYNVFEISFFVMILITGVALLANRYIDWMWYVILFFVLIAALVTNHRALEIKNPKSNANTDTSEKD